MRKAFAGFAAGIVFAALAGCSGGGGGGGGAQGPVQYTGNTNQATISESNSGLLAAAATNSAGTAEITGAVSSVAPSSGSQQSEGIMDVGRRIAHTVLSLSAKPRAEARLTSAPFDQTSGCENGIGTVRTFGDADPVTAVGTINFTFTNCLSAGDTLNGTLTLTVTRTILGLGAPLPTDFTLSFGRLSLRGPVILDVGGTIHVVVDVPTNKETVTQNVVAVNLITGRVTKSEVTFVDTYDNVRSPTPTLFSRSISGRVFDGTHGFVTIDTPKDLRFVTATQLFPSGGEVILTGANNRRIQVLPNSAARVTLGLDLDGNGVFRKVRLGWTDLTGPIGSDLADNDGDGMHNSWETAVGLNPDVFDNAADDRDGDGFSNIAEYRDGGNPANASVIPMLTVGAPTPVASGVSPGTLNTPATGRSGIASDGTNYLLVSCRVFDPGFFGLLMSETGQVLRDFRIMSGPCTQRPAVAFGGGNYLVALTSGAQLLGFRVTPAGEVLNPSGDPISSLTDGSVSNDFPSVAFDGTNFLAVWSKSIQFTRIHAARVSTGAPPFVLNDFPVTSGANDSLPGVAFDGDNYLVVWTSGFSRSEDVRGARVSPAGTVLDSTPIPIATGPTSEIGGGVAFDGTNYLVVWNQSTDPSVPPTDGQIFGRRLAKTGTLVDATAIPISTGLFQNHSASVAFAGNSFLVTWSVGHFPGFSTTGIFATRVSKAGVRMDGQPGELGVVVSGTPSIFSTYVNPVAASNGRSAFIAWVNNNAASPEALKEILAAPVSGP